VPAPPAASPAASPRWATVALVATTAIWGGSFLMGKVALEELTPADTALWRFLIAGVSFLPLVRRVPRPATAREWGHVALAALLGVPLLFVLQLEGLSRTTATKSALMIGTLPPMAALVAVVALGERLTARVAVSLLLSCAGLALVIGLPGAGGSLTGDLLVILSVAVSVAFIMLSRPLTVRLGALGTSVWTMLLGAAWLLLLVPLWKGVPHVPQKPSTWAALLGLGVACTTVAQPLWNVGLRALGAARASLFVNLEPVFGALLGVLVLREPFGLGLAAGGGLVLAAALLAAWEPSPAPSADSEAAFGHDELIVDAAATEGGGLAADLPAYRE